METVTVHEAKTHFSKLLARAKNGEEIIIAKGKEPQAKLVPLTPKPQRQPGTLPGLTVPPSFFEPLSEEELGLWEGGND